MLKFGFNQEEWFDVESDQGGVLRVGISQEEWFVVDLVIEKMVCYEELFDADLVNEEWSGLDLVKRSFFFTFLVNTKSKSGNLVNDLVKEKSFGRSDLD